MFQSQSGGFKPDGRRAATLTGEVEIRADDSHDSFFASSSDNGCCITVITPSTIFVAKEHAQSFSSFSCTTKTSTPPTTAVAAAVLRVIVALPVRVEPE